MCETCSSQHRRILTILNSKCVLNCTPVRPPPQPQGGAAPQELVDLDHLGLGPHLHRLQLVGGLRDDAVGVEDGLQADGLGDHDHLHHEVRGGGGAVVAARALLEGRVPGKTRT